MTFDLVCGKLSLRKPSIFPVRYL